MNIKPLAVALAILILFSNIGLCAQGPLKIMSDNTTESPVIGPVIGLGEAAERSNNSENSASSEPPVNSETVENKDFIRNEISAGNSIFVRSIVNGLYADFQNSSVTDEYGDAGGLIFSAVTFVPNPYDDTSIVELYGGYLNLTIYLIVLFVLGELISRSAARTKLTTGVLGHKDLSGYHFIGGIAMCGFAIVANLIYMGALDVVEALNEFITLPAMPNITPGPDNLLMFALGGLCDLLVVGFFVVRYFMLYVIAVVCSIIAFLLVPELTRDFATNCIEKIIRILALQPAALFVTVMGLIAFDGLPSPLKPFAYIGLTVLILLTCWYFMFGSFKLLKTAVVFAIRKGVTKI